MHFSNDSIPYHATTNGTKIAEEATTAVKAFISTIAIAFHFVAVFILLLQIRQDAQGKKQLRLTHAEAPKLVFLAGTLFILLGVYFSEDDSKHLIATLHELYHISTGLGIGIGVYLFGCYKFLNKLPNGRTDERARRRTRSIERNEPSCDNNEEEEADVCQPSPEDHVILLNPRRLILKQTQPLLGTFITIMTMSIVVIEIVFVLSPFGIINFDTSEVASVSFNGIKLFHLKIGTTLTYMMQIVVQNICYIFFIKNRHVSPRYINSTRFFLQLMAFYNFTMFIQSLWERYWNQLEVYDNFRVAEDVYKHGSGINILFMIYSALAINMRVMFVYIFMEHADSLGKGNPLEMQVEVDLNKERNAGNNLNNNADRNQSEADRYIRVRVLSRDEKMYSNCGYFIGILCVVLHVLMAVQYIKALDIGASFNIFSVVGDVTVVLIGWMIVRVNIKRGGPNIVNFRYRTSFVRMVNLLGILGFIFNLTKACLVTFLAVRSYQSDGTYYTWDAIKHVSGTLVVLYLLGIINIIYELAPIIRDGHEKKNYCLLPALMLGVLAMGAGVALDQYEGRVIKFIRSNLSEPSIQMILETGPPLILAFFWDVFFSILVIFRDHGVPD